jgi:hypothetical protein
MSQTFHPAFILVCNNILRMFEVDTSPRPTRRFLLLAGLAGSMMLGYGTALAQAPATISGAYKILIRGNYTGEGVATVTEGFVTIDANVKDDNGFEGKLTITQAGLVGDHFKGTGTVMGGALTVQGRVEAKDPDPKAPGNGNGAQNAAGADPVVSDARIGATFAGPRGRGGRIVGAKVNPPPPAK